MFHNFYKNFKVFIKYFKNIKNSTKFLFYSRAATAALNTKCTSSPPSPPKGFTSIHVVCCFFFIKSLKPCNLL